MLLGKVPANELLSFWAEVLLQQHFAVGARGFDEGLGRGHDTNSSLSAQRIVLEGLAHIDKHVCDLGEDHRMLPAWVG